ncbi:hypothetical protein PCL1606_57000 [Pseudomonas chlororaphis]|uniref:Uncharacterized protein n=1 Tax=Pseudomonas chlororaphis TaxID=587753 RepID=A0A0D5Y814_9PSED|nr:hypothetical protein PCL1606_57000 [Pseudomonas chlororaphis]
MIFDELNRLRHSVLRVASGGCWCALRMWVMPAPILGHGNLPHKGANCMPVPCDGFYAPNSRIPGGIWGKSVNRRTAMLRFCEAMNHFGA